MAEPIKIYPTIEDCQIKNKITCPDCSQAFTSESNLNLHIAKTHVRSDLQRVTAEKWYFCPINQCPWNEMMHFKRLKNLRQHFVKSHMVKQLKCPSCTKCFALETELARHSEYCSVWFSCLNCNASYGCYETLKTHCRRKDHKLLRKQDYKELGGQQVVQIKETLMRTTVTQATQTELKVGTDKCSVETQTSDWSKSTSVVESKESSCNTSFNIEDFEFTMKEHIQMNSSSTQTQSFPSDLLTNLDPNLFNCSSKTQTDMLFPNEFCNDFYSDMYTQTCDEILSGLTDIQTQTVQDTLRSVESQTLMSSADRLCPSIFKDIVHTETQTDEEFRQILEIINS